jgi:hypothetical protein
VIKSEHNNIALLFLNSLINVQYLV